MTTSEMLDFIYNAQSAVLKRVGPNTNTLTSAEHESLKEANSYIHELIARLAKSGDTELEEQAKPETPIVAGVPQSVEIYKVHGVTIYDKGIVQGTALYKELFDSKKIKDCLNRKYAELKVPMEAKLVQYPILKIKQ